MGREAAKSVCSQPAALRTAHAWACMHSFPHSQPHPPLSACLTPLPQYEPELFPGLIYRMVDPKIVLLIFVSGKVVLTGEPSGTLPLLQQGCPWDA